MELNELLNKYAELDKEVKEKSNTLKEYNKNIKEEMENLNEEIHSNGVFQAKITFKKSININEEALSEYLKNDWLSKHDNLNDCPYLATKLVVNMDTLETMLYNGKLDSLIQEKMKECMSEKVTKALSIKAL